MQIKIGKVPGRTQVLELQEGATIAEAVRQANLDVSGHELRYNGTSTENFNKEIIDGAIILLTPRIKGNMDTEYIEVYFNNEEFCVRKNDTVKTLLDEAEVDSDEMGFNKTVAMIRGEDVIAVDLSDKVVRLAKYDIVDKSEVTTTYSGYNAGNVINVSNNSATGEITKIVVGDIEIVINKLG